MELAVKSDKQYTPLQKKLIEIFSSKEGSVYSFGKIVITYADDYEEEYSE